MEPYHQENGHEARTSLTDHAQRPRWLSGPFVHSAPPLGLDPFPDYLVDPQIQADQPQARLQLQAEENEHAQQPLPQGDQYPRYPSYPTDGLPYPPQYPMPPSPMSMGAPASRQTPNHLQQTRRDPAIPDHLYGGHAGVQYTGGALGPMMPSPTLTAPEWSLTPSPTSVPAFGFPGMDTDYLGGPDAYSPWLGADDDDPAWPPGRSGSCSASQAPSQSRGPVPSAQDTDAWTYSVDVWPAQQPANSKERHIDEHIVAIQKTLLNKGYWDPTFELVPAKPGREACRRYILPRRYRDDEKARLEFLQVFNANRPYNRALPNYRYSMSVASMGYEARPFGLHNDPYPTIDETEAAHDAGVPADEHGTFADHAVSELTNFSPPSPHSSLLPPPPPPAGTEHHDIDLPASSSPPDMPLAEAAAAAAAAAAVAPLTPAASGQRTKAVPKPDREVRRTPDGKFLCSWDGCNEPVKTFSRKCEWSKHMDKHDRPYKCSVPGCEKLPGFTYSGGLLRHQREVHKQHGGPRNPLHCPHASCKRATGKGFSRLENLNEHLRRVHTSGGGGGEGGRAGDEHDDAASAGGPGEGGVGGVGVGEKRKAAADDEDLRGEVKKLHTENLELKQQLASQQDKIKTQEQRLIAMQTQMMTLQNYLSQQPQHPSGPLHNQPAGHLASGSPGSTMLGDACDF